MSSGIRHVVARVLSALRRGRAEDDLTREMTAHLALLEDQFRSRGMSPDEARLAARRAMGSVALARDRHRDARSFVWVEDVRRDLHHAARALRRKPGFTAIAVVALGLGIGVNTTFFTMVDAICLRGLPIDSPDRVMFIDTRDAAGRPGPLSYDEFDDIRRRSTSFEQFAGYINTVVALADDRQPPARVLGAFVSAGAFELLGVRPVVGRTFRPDEDLPGSPGVVILGGEIWSARYGGNPGIVGQVVTVNSVPSTVIGVMPRGFQFPSNADVWRPMASMPPLVRQARGDRRLAVAARMTDGVTEDQARGDMDAIAASWAREFPATNRDVRVQITPINEQLNPSVWQRSWIAFITAGALVLLVACANVANLLLMRAAGRGREIAIRTSIGATRWRVVRQLLVESATLAALAGVGGVALSWVGLRLVSGLIPPETMPYWMAFTIDGRVLAVVLAVCLGCVFVCGLPSAIHLSRVDTQSALLEGGSTTTMHAPARRWIAALLAAEFAVTLVLTAMAVWSVRGSVEWSRREFMVNPAALLTMWVNLPSDVYRTPDARTTFFDRLDERVRSRHIDGIAYTSALPLGGGSQRPLAISDRSLGDVATTVHMVAVSERYFSVLGIPLRQGRVFGAADGRTGSLAAIVNERFVQMFLGNDDPLDALIRVGDATEPWLPIIGVTTTVRQQVLGNQPGPVVYVPFRQAPPLSTALVVRTTDEAGPATALLRSEVAAIDPNLPLYRVMTFEQAMRNATWNGRLSDVIIRTIAIVALVLALVGLYAVTGHAVERWRRELALRIAFGAEVRQVAWIVLKRVLSQLGVGLALGLAGTVAFDRVFNDPANAAPGVGMTDPGMLAAIVVAIVAVALFACLVPIRRASRVDPIQTLRMG